MALKVDLTFTVRPQHPGQCCNFQWIKAISDFSEL